MTTPTTRETADHAELARLAEAATQGQWWTEKTKSYYSVKANRPRYFGGNRKPAGIAYITKPTKYSIPNLEFIAAANPATVLALLSEIAALRGEVAKTERDHTELRDSYDAVVAKLAIERDHGTKQSIRATQAERQRDELRKALERIAYTPDGEDGLSLNESVDLARQALANQGADQ